MRMGIFLGFFTGFGDPQRFGDILTLVRTNNQSRCGGLDLLALAAQFLMMQVVGLDW